MCKLYSWKSLSSWLEGGFCGNYQISKEGPTTKRKPGRQRNLTRSGANRSTNHAWTKQKETTHKGHAIYTVKTC